MLGVVSSIANSLTLQPYIFRNYDRLPGRDSHFRGGCNYLLWQALQASAAAPGYFEEVCYVAANYLLNNCCNLSRIICVLVCYAYLLISEVTAASKGIFFGRKTVWICCLKVTQILVNLNFFRDLSVVSVRWRLDPFCIKMVEYWSTTQQRWRCMKQDCFGLVKKFTVLFLSAVDVR